MPLRNKSEFMTQEELLTIAHTFIRLGVNKIRLTGGEPLLKKNFHEILMALSAYPVELAITTNGILLDRYWSSLQMANLKKINISLDSLDADRFNEISRRQYFDRIWTNLHKAIKRFRGKNQCRLNQRI